MPTLRTFRSHSELDAFSALALDTYYAMLGARARGVAAAREPHKAALLDRLARRAMNYRAEREHELDKRLRDDLLDEEEAVIWPLLKKRIDEEFDAEVASELEN